MREAIPGSVVVHELGESWALEAFSADNVGEHPDGARLDEVHALGVGVLLVGGHARGPEPSLLRHISPLGWDHIVLTGDYDWNSGAGVRSNVHPLYLYPAKIRA